MVCYCIFAEKHSHYGTKTSCMALGWIVLSIQNTHRRPLWYHQDLKMSPSSASRLAYLERRRAKWIFIQDFNQKIQCFLWRKFTYKKIFIIFCVIYAKSFIIHDYQDFEHSKKENWRYFWNNNDSMNSNVHFVSVHYFMKMKNSERK